MCIPKRLLDSEVLPIHFARDELNVSILFVILSCLLALDARNLAVAGYQLALASHGERTFFAGHRPIILVLTANI